MNYRLLFILSFLLSFGAFAQETEINHDRKPAWSLLVENDGVKIYSQTVECPFEGMKPTIYAFLKIENTNDAETMLHFNFGLQYTETCSGCDENSEFAQRVLIPANSSVEGSCSKPNYLGRIVRNLNNPVAGWHFENVIINYITVD